MIPTRPSPKISVVTVSYNQGRFIRRAIDSVLAQRYPNFEHIVVDGGSTDETVEILKEYPHLRWTSERDNGQCDALNKGFARADGEIIAWLNSDDWYEIGIFEKVAEALHDHEVALAASVQTDEHGVPTEYIANPLRSKYDILRYWVPYAWLAQPSVFFTKRALEAVRYRDGYLDEGLYFCMDYDLWMRLAEQFEFCAISGVASYFRIYAENKTGKHPLAAQRECSRVYRKFCNILSKRERSISYVITVKEISEDFGRTFSSIADQDLIDAEVLIADYSGDKESGKRLKEAALELGDVTPELTIRYISGDDYLHAFNEAVRSVAAPIVTLLKSGDVVQRDFTREALNLFNADVMGLAFPFSSMPLLRDALLDAELDALSLKGLFSSPFFFPRLVARTVALQEIEGFLFEAPPLAIRHLILRLVFKAWKISVSNPLSVTPGVDRFTQEEELLSQFSNYYNYRALLEVLKENDKDPFSPIRASITPEVSPALREEAEMALRLLPEDWIETDRLRDTQFLLALLEKRPDFAPGWFYLARGCEANGNSREGLMARERYLSLQKMR